MKSEIWPNDADGDVLRGLKADGFDFSRPCTIDFNIDFDTWPPSSGAMTVIQREFPGAKVYDGEGDQNGYVLFKITALLTSDLVVDTQARVSALMAPYGGRCESWGVLA